MDDSFYQVYRFFIANSGKIWRDGEKFRIIYRVNEKNLENSYGYEWGIDYYGKNRDWYDGWYQILKGL